VLGTWTRAVLQLGAGAFTLLYVFTSSNILEDQLFAPARGEHRTSWLVLIRRAALLLAQSVADSPE
jgi:hypothetical protein